LAKPERRAERIAGAARGSELANEKGSAWFAIVSWWLLAELLCWRFSCASV
jgi:hypothetical protein